MRCKMGVLSIASAICILVLASSMFVFSSAQNENVTRKTYRSIEAVSLRNPIPVIKRAKGQIDNIRVNDISPYEIKEVIMTESVETNPLKDQSHYRRHYNSNNKYESHDKYNYYDKYGKDKYGKYKYDKKDGYDKYNKYDKYSKHDKYDKYDKYDKHHDKYDSKYDKYDDKYDKYDKYGKNDDKYGKNDDKYGKNDDKYGKYDDKYGKHDDKYGKSDDKNKYSKKDKYEEYCYPTQKKMQCTAFMFAIEGTTANLYKSVAGADLELASTYTAETAVSVHLFSNWARGGYCPNRDIEFGVAYANATTAVGRLRYENDAATLVYDHLVDGGEDFYDFGPYVTSILIPKGIFYVDAHQTQFEDLDVAPFTQVDINPVTNQQVAIALGQTACFDAVFFNKECSRWLCVGERGYLTSYLKDPATGQIGVPPVSSNPQQYTDQSIWYTGTLLCGKMRFASVGYDSINNNEWVFTRSRLTLKFPYFKETAVIYTTNSPAQFSTSYIYSPPHTNVIYACIGTTFYRFDNAYTSSVPITPFEQDTLFDGDGCVRITSFKECTNEVYVTTEAGTIYYSPNGGASFTQVVSPTFADPNGLVGFAVPTY